MIDPESNQMLERYIRQLISPSMEEWEAFSGCFSSKRLEKREKLLKEGQVCNFIAFVTKGILREYNYQGDTEVTVDFTVPNNFVTDYPSS